MASPTARHAVPSHIWPPHMLPKGQKTAFFQRELVAQGGLREAQSFCKPPLRTSVRSRSTPVGSILTEADAAEGRIQQPLRTHAVGVSRETGDKRFREAQSFCSRRSPLSCEGCAPTQWESHERPDTSGFPEARSLLFDHRTTICQANRLPNYRPCTIRTSFELFRASRHTACLSCAEIFFPRSTQTPRLRAVYNPYDHFPIDHRTLMTCLHLILLLSCAAGLSGCSSLIASAAKPTASPLTSTATVPATSTPRPTLIPTATPLTCLSRP